MAISVSFTAKTAIINGENRPLIEKFTGPKFGVMHILNPVYDSTMRELQKKIREQYGFELTADNVKASTEANTCTVTVNIFGLKLETTDLDAFKTNMSAMLSEVNVHIQRMLKPMLAINLGAAFYVSDVRRYISEKDPGVSPQSASKDPQAHEVVKELDLLGIKSGERPSLS